MPARHRDEAGSATTEVVLLMPVVLMLVLLIVQFGLWLHARQVATAAAQEGLVAAQVETGTAAAGHARAVAFLAQTGGLRGTSVDASRDVTTARVAVTGTTPAVLPGTALGVSAVAQGPVERFVADGDR
jgi:Flp pilus assembly protein TadG